MKTGETEENAGVSRGGAGSAEKRQIQPHHEGHEEHEDNA